MGNEQEEVLRFISTTRDNVLLDSEGQQIPEIQAEFKTYIAIITEREKVLKARASPSVQSRIFRP